MEQNESDIYLTRLYEIEGDVAIVKRLAATILGLSNDEITSILLSYISLRIESGLNIFPIGALSDSYNKTFITLGKGYRFWIVDEYYITNLQNTIATWSWFWPLSWLFSPSKKRFTKARFSCPLFDSIYHINILCKSIEMKAYRRSLMIAIPSRLIGGLIGVVFHPSIFEKVFEKIGEAVGDTLGDAVKEKVLQKGTQQLIDQFHRPAPVNSASVQPD